jgi:hypothetical protein
MHPLASPQGRSAPEGKGATTEGVCIKISSASEAVDVDADAPAVSIFDEIALLRKDFWLNAHCVDTASFGLEIDTFPL